MGDKQTKADLEKRCDLLQETIGLKENEIIALRSENSSMKDTISKTESNLREMQRENMRMYEERHLVYKVVVGEAESSSKIQVLKDLFKQNHHPRYNPMSLL